MLKVVSRTEILTPPTIKKNKNQPVKSRKKEMPNDYFALTLSASSLWSTQHQDGITVHQKNAKKVFLLRSSLVDTCITQAIILSHNVFSYMVILFRQTMKRTDLGYNAIRLVYHTRSIRKIHQLSVSIIWPMTTSASQDMSCRIHSQDKLQFFLQKSLN